METTLTCHLLGHPTAKYNKQLKSSSFRLRLSPSSSSPFPWESRSLASFPEEICNLIAQLIFKCFPGGAKGNSPSAMSLFKSRHHRLVHSSHPFRGELYSLPFSATATVFITFNRAPWQNFTNTSLNEMNSNQIRSPLPQ